jgi:hypothetical protein
VSNYRGAADEGSHHPDRNAQFERIDAKVVAAQSKGEPVISVDTKKKELVSNFTNGGSGYRPKGEPTACQRARIRRQRAGRDGAVRRLRRPRLI